MLKANLPIGIFDSGIGGLTVARAVKKLLPNEHIVYFGDLEHLPYGDKSKAVIQAFCIKIVDFLLEKKCKVILIACNSASAAAYELICEYVGTRAIILNVIDPVVDHFEDTEVHKTIGLIGTKQTIGSNVYADKMNHRGANISLKALATPLLVPMIEEGFHEDRISEEIINTYLSKEELSGIESLILGCTHYPVIKTQIESYYQGKVEVIDSASMVAKALHKLLIEHGLNRIDTPSEKNAFYSSDVTPAFIHATRLFFGHEIQLDRHKLWR